MCGIAGLLDPALAGNGAGLAAAASAMAESLVHRGPDRGAIAVEEAAGLALAHRRLAIVDLSAAGDQPMRSACGRFLTVYNGEVFNSAEIREEIEDTRGPLAWRGHSDTETIIEAIATWGVAATAERLIGMFAFAVWDHDRRALWLVRDRLGIKPVFWSLRGGRFLFGSELKALRAGGFVGPVDPGALAAFLRLGYVPGPGAILQDVQKLPPGTVLHLPWLGAPTITAYWQLAEVVAEARKARPLSDTEAADRLDALLRDAVQRRLVSDVPLGAFLSGGIDSSTVTALMQRAAGGRVRTFSLGFRDVGFDEAPHAAAVARHLGTEHTELYATEDDALDVIPRLSCWFDEPFADQSAVPTYLLARLARAQVTVALSGDGGDELFAGYPRYVNARRALAGFSAVPRPLRSAAGALARAMLGGTRGPAGARRLGARAADLLDLRDAASLYERFLSRFAHVPMAGHGGGPGAVARAWAAAPVTDAGARMQFADTLTYLPEDILAKLDRATMASGLEARVPLLDHRVVAFAWSLPRHQKLRNGQAKWLLRQVLHRYVPRSLVERPKQGFELPLSAWLRGRLRPWAESLLAELPAPLDPAPIRALWADHLAGRRDDAGALWAVLMWRAWQQRWGG